MPIAQQVQNRTANGSSRRIADRARTDNIWVETAWAVLDVACDLNDRVTIEACQRIIVDEANGGLPCQSDVNLVLWFRDAHSH
jgi:hypothetical protein